MEERDGSRRWRKEQRRGGEWVGIGAKSDVFTGVPRAYDYDEWLGGTMEGPQRGE